MKDLIIGSIMNYQPKDVACWINSIKQSGFTGDVKVLHFGGCPPETLYYLTDKGVTVLYAELNGRHIVVERFFAMYCLLANMHQYYMNVLATDVKDVVFQRNPSEILAKIPVHKSIMVTAENIKYKDEDWGRNNMQVSFPHMYEKMKEEVIYNAGFIGGHILDIRDFFLHIYHLSLIGGDPQPDQAAMNILIQSSPFSYNTFYRDESDHCAIHLGTSWADNVKDKYKDKLIEGYSEDLSPFYALHQWDRVAHLRESIRNRFGNID